MIVITETIQLMMQGRKEYTCPGCQDKNVFFNYSPKTCPECKIALPDLYAIIHENSELLKWHFEENTTL